MTKLKDFYNKVSNNNRIFTAEDIGNMSSKDFSKNEKAIDYQMKNLGIPRQHDLVGNSDVIYVHAYKKSDGTQVKAHYRSKAGSIGTETVTGGAADLDTKYNTRYSEIKSLDAKTTKHADFSQLESSRFLAKFNAERNKYRPDARELMNIALSGFENLLEHPDFTVFNPESAQYVNSVLNIESSPGLLIPKNWHGVIYNHNSGFSKRISNSPELQNQVLACYDRKTNTFKTNQIGIGFSQDKNLNYSIGHGTILNPKVDLNGNFSGMLFDKYDFKWLSKEEMPNKDTRNLNNGAYGMQQINRIKNYYIIVPVQFKIWR